MSGSRKGCIGRKEGTRIINGPSGPRLFYVAGRKAGVYLFLVFLLHNLL